MIYGDDNTHDWLEKVANDRKYENRAALLAGLGSQAPLALAMAGIGYAPLMANPLGALATLGASAAGGAALGAKKGHRRQAALHGAAGSVAGLMAGSMAGSGLGMIAAKILSRKSLNSGDARILGRLGGSLLGGVAGSMAGAAAGAKWGHRKGIKKRASVEIYTDDNIHDAMEKLAGAQREAYMVVKPRFLAAMNARSPKEFRKANKAIEKLDPWNKKGGLSKAERKVMRRSTMGKGGPMSGILRSADKSFARGSEAMLTRKHYRAPTATWTPKRMRGKG